MKTAQKGVEQKVVQILMDLLAKKFCKCNLEEHTKKSDFKVCGPPFSYRQQGLVTGAKMDDF